MRWKCRIQRLAFVRCDLVVEIPSSHNMLSVGTTVFLVITIWALEETIFGLLSIVASSGRN
jgi:hypothetical protein